MINDIRSLAIFRHGQRRTKLLRHFLRKFLNDWSMDFSAMLAYNLLIALLPIAVALFGILGLVLKNHPNTQNEIKDKIIHLFPSDNTTQAGIKQVKTTVATAEERYHNNYTVVLLQLYRLETSKAMNFVDF